MWEKPVENKACPKCVFFEIVRSKKEPFPYALCHLSGERDPEKACWNFTRGRHEDLAVILRIAEGERKKIDQNFIYDFR